MDERFALPIRILHDAAGRFERLNIPYMLSGSTAMMYYSVYRLTADIDIVLELKSEDAPALIKAFEPDYYVPHSAIRSAVSSGRMFNVIHTQTAYKIDCIIKKTTDFQKAVFERRQKVHFFGSDIWIITVEDLILSKLLWAKDSKSEMQHRDVQNLMFTEHDKELVGNLAVELGVSEDYKQLLAELEI